MMFSRPGSLPPVLLCSWCLTAGVFLLDAQPPPAQSQGQTPAQPAKPPQQQPPPPRKPNPFETVPTAAPEPKQEAPKPQAPATPNPAVQTAPNVNPNAAPPDNVIEALEFRGARRVPQDTLRALVTSKKGDNYDEERLRRDFMILWNSGRFDDLRLEREPGQTGWILRYIVVERPVVRSIKYEGNKSITVSEILDRFKERKVGLVVEQQYDPNKIQRAKNVLQEYESERGHQYAKIVDEIR